jgi:hypothetical protein
MSKIKMSKIKMSKIKMSEKNAQNKNVRNQNALKQRNQNAITEHADVFFSPSTSPDVRNHHFPLPQYRLIWTRAWIIKSDQSLSSPNKEPRPNPPSSLSLLQAV